HAQRFADEHAKDQTDGKQGNAVDYHCSYSSEGLPVRGRPLRANTSNDDMTADTVAQFTRAAHAVVKRDS
ncbi:MAG: hypothetical protein VXW45_00005, partial [Pseudomonadota bacterium]|nr:hypothetical protein [Pseudomonadota bacterium]